MASHPRTYFDSMYARDADPWAFETSAYERRKYALTVASLPEPRYRSAFEPGCSLGVLSARLAERCERLLATDIVPSVVDRAARRLEEFPHVTAQLRAIPEEWPEGPFDLVVLSEIAYYFDRPTLEVIVDRILATTGPEATVIAVHWRGPTDYPLSGDQAHAVLGACPAFEAAVHHDDEEFVLDVWRRRGGGAPSPLRRPGPAAGRS
jgi:hypothetical protein